MNIQRFYLNNRSKIDRAIYILKMCERNKMYKLAKNSVHRFDVRGENNLVFH